MSPTGVLLVDKPGGMTSHDVVSRARRALGTRKIGHAGTLDPMATGLLVLGVGSATRLLTYVVGLGKQYTATIRLGAATTTDDAEGELLGSLADATGLDRAALAAGVAALTGEIAQRPSSVSAIKVDGRRAYDRVRAGEEVELAARTVTVARFDIVADRLPPDAPGMRDLDVVVDCSSGTYIRALARDLGAGLGVGGHLTALRRTEIGPFQVADAVRGAADGPGGIAPEALRPAADIARALFPVAELDEAQRTALGQGKRIPLGVPDAKIVATLADDVLAGLVRVQGGVAKVLVNFPADEVLT